MEAFDEIHRRIAVLPRGRGNIGFYTDDGSESLAGELFVKLFGTSHVAVVSDGDTGHFKFFCHFDKPRSGTRSVEHTVMGVQMQMNEVGRHKNSPW